MKFLGNKKCTSSKDSKRATKVAGRFLNDYLHQKQVFAEMIRDVCITPPFNSRKKYFICWNLKRNTEKMLYLLTQHSAWNGKYHLFLLCDCARGEGEINNKHQQCKIISNYD